jgi:hypothetical protein
MMMIEISESKVEKMSDYAEKMLRYGGKLMQCIEELSEGEGMGGMKIVDMMTIAILTKKPWVNAVVMAEVVILIVVVWVKDAVYGVPDAIHAIANV